VRTLTWREVPRMVRLKFDPGFLIDPEKHAAHEEKYVSEGMIEVSYS
jgi:hypothetical protein